MTAEGGKASSSFWVAQRRSPKPARAQSTRKSLSKYFWRVVLGLHNGSARGQENPRGSPRGAANTQGIPWQGNELSWSQHRAPGAHSAPAGQETQPSSSRGAAGPSLPSSSKENSQEAAGICFLPAAVSPAEFAAQAPSLRSEEAELARAIWGVRNGAQEHISIFITPLGGAERTETHLRAHQRNNRATEHPGWKGWWVQPPHTPKIHPGHCPNAPEALAAFPVPSKELCPDIQPKAALAQLQPFPGHKNQPKFTPRISELLFL